MKKLLFTTFFLCLLQTLFAQAPELKNIMPNSWDKLTRLSEQEEKEFLNLSQVKNDIENVESRVCGNTQFDIKEVRVYKETANNIVFYRVLACNQNMDDFFKEEYKDATIPQATYDDYTHKRIQQTVYVKTKSKKIEKILSREYKVYGIADGNMETDGCDYFVFHDFFIKELNKNEIGFFMTEASIGYDVKRKNQSIVCSYSKIKDQLCGANCCEFLRVKNNEDFVKAFSDYKRRIRISASNYLFDPKCPLKYSIQNAFDGNPATSYVENTEDDLMKLDVWLGKVVDKMGIINGYAQSKELYNANNRIRQISNYFELEDNNLTYQFINCRGTNNLFTSYYRGNKYNDTCIAEINYLLDGKWLFGDIDE